MLNISSIEAAKTINENTTARQLNASLNVFCIWVWRVRMWGESPYTGMLSITVAETQVTVKMDIYSPLLRI